MKNDTKSRLVYLRYILPVASVCAIVALMFIPCYSYITADAGINEAISLWELLGNSWNTAREYLFGSGEKLAVTTSFARTLLVLIGALLLLFVIGFVSTVYTAVTAFRYFSNGCRDSKATTLFITLVPNRAVLCIYHATVLPLLLLPRIMPLLYKNILSYYVELNTAPFDIVIIAAAVYAINVAVIAACSRLEVSVQMNIFKKRSVSDDCIISDEETETDIMTDEPYERMSQAEKREQTERIMRLLEKSRGDGDGEDEEEKEDFE